MDNIAVFRFPTPPTPPGGLKMYGYGKNPSSSSF